MLEKAVQEQPELVDDPRFADVQSRLQHLDALRHIVLDFAQHIPDADTFERMFTDHGLATGQVREPGELADTDWAAERGATVEIDDRNGGTVRVPNVPWRFSAGPGVTVNGVPKYRGEDNRTTLANLLGYDDDRLDRLEAVGVLSARIPTDITAPPGT